VLIPPNSFSLGFSNVTPTLHIDGTTIGAFTASYSGTVSSEAAAVSEPLGLAVMGVGLLGLTMVRYRRS
jgi:hypothetical protein